MAPRHCPKLRRATDPLVTSNGIDFSAPHVLGIVAIAATVVLVAAILRRFVMASGDELAELWRQYGPIGLRRLLARRNMPSTPWFCARCRSHNARATTRCYACGAKREEAQADVPSAETPASPSGGLSQRTRR